MTYKFLNTIIDDLFAWVITMPFLHRLAGAQACKHSVRGPVPPLHGPVSCLSIAHCSTVHSCDVKLKPV
jgi:hypothetical protein